MSLRDQSSHLVVTRLRWAMHRLSTMPLKFPADTTRTARSHLFRFDIRTVTRSLRCRANTLRVAPTHLALSHTREAVRILRFRESFRQTAPIQCAITCIQEPIMVLRSSVDTIRTAPATLAPSSTPMFPNLTSIADTGRAAKIPCASSSTLTMALDHAQAQSSASTTELGVFSSRALLQASTTCRKERT